MALHGHLGREPGRFSPYVPSPDVSSEDDLPDVQKLIGEGEENSALLVQHNSETTFQRMDEELRNKGIVFTDLHTAPGNTKISSRSTFKLVPDDYDKFSALSAALFAGGSFLYVPRGVDVEVPIQSYGSTRSAPRCRARSSSSKKMRASPT